MFGPNEIFCHTHVPTLHKTLFSMNAIFFILMTRISNFQSRNVFFSYNLLDNIMLKVLDRVFQKNKNCANHASCHQQCIPLMTMKSKQFKSLAQQEKVITMQIQNVNKANTKQIQVNYKAITNKLQSKQKRISMQRQSKYKGIAMHI